MPLPNGGGTTAGTAGRVGTTEGVVKAGTSLLTSGAVTAGGLTITFVGLLIGVGVAVYASTVSYIWVEIENLSTYHRDDLLLGNSDSSLSADAETIALAVTELAVSGLTVGRLVVGGATGDRVDSDVFGGGGSGGEGRSGLILRLPHCLLVYFRLRSLYTSISIIELYDGALNDYATYLDNVVSLSSSTVNSGGNDGGGSASSKSVGESEILSVRVLLWDWNGTGQTCAQRNRWGGNGLRGLLKRSRDHKDRRGNDIRAVAVSSSLVEVERVNRLANRGQRNHEGNGDLAREVHVGR